MASASRTCPECGLEAASREAGCPRCGHIFQQIEGAAPPGPRAASAPTAASEVGQPGGSTGWKTVFAATCGCFVLVGLAGALVTWLVGRQFEGLAEELARVQQEGDLLALRRALEAYADDHDGRYPAALAELTARDGGGPWIEALPRDRWGHAFVFEPPPEGERARGPGRLVTLGSDGAPGGEGAAADLDEAALGLRPGPR